jgi:hypothetical protein
MMLDDQVQLYANNCLISHPLVSPINQGSLGGLCPLMIVRPNLPIAYLSSLSLTSSARSAIRWVVLVSCCETR